MRTTVTIRFQRFRYMVLALFFLLFLLSPSCVVYAQTETGDPDVWFNWRGSCHRRLALQDGSLWLWGDNRFGLLVLPARTTSTSPGA